MNGNFRSQRKSRNLRESETNNLSPYVLPICKHALPLTTSTRGIGFAVSNAYEFISAFPKSAVNIHQMYRASLIQFQAKLFLASRNMIYHQMVPTNYKNMDMNEEQFRTMIAVRKPNFFIIADIINSFGPFYFRGIHYQPYIPEYPCPDAYTVTINNLRETVVALSASTPDTKEARWNFYTHNSIPGARWEVREDIRDAVLINADEIIPDNCNLISDYYSFSMHLQGTKYYRKYPEYFKNIIYDSNAKGHECQLVCIEKNEYRIPNSQLNITENGEEVNKHFHPEGNELDGYAFDDLDTETQELGTLCLYGEQNSDNFDHKTAGCRSKLTGFCEFSLYWASCCSRRLAKIKYERIFYMPSAIRSVKLPVSTRGIGFAVSYSYTLIDDQQLEISIYELFRYSLLQFQYKICLNNLDLASFDFWPSTTWQRKELSLSEGFPYVFNIGLVAKIINNIGLFEKHSVKYSPFFSAYASAVPNPFYVTIENLRDTVVALSSITADSKQVRWKFYQHNSLPGAIWDVDEANEDAVLTNPDEIMPQNYEFLNDYANVNKFQHLLDRKNVKYGKLVLGKVNFHDSVQGNACQLVSIPVSGDRIPSSKKLDNSRYQHYPPTSNGISGHARSLLNTEEMFYGILGLYGEYSNDFMDANICTSRSQSTGSCSTPIVCWKSLARAESRLDVH